jgi:hypothetical protein
MAVMVDHCESCGFSSAAEMTAGLSTSDVNLEKWWKKYRKNGATL